MSTDKKNRVNEQITARQVRLIGPDGENVGVVTTEQAQRIAEESQLDLVEIVPTADPPVCRVMDFGKFLFEQNKKKHAAKRKQKQIQIKEMKIRPGTEEGDYQIKLRNMTRFLEEGDKVKVTLRFRGRELMHQDLGAKVLKRIEEDLSALGVVEQFPRLEGKQMVMMIAPKRAQ
ncbi:MAG: translation initiation factor IF-3 [Gammaproteobacteria bacterium]|nr:translation initiation factor IF-3 [Gammaproteobacteria bacterium]